MNQTTINLDVIRQNVKALAAIAPQAESLAAQQKESPKTKQLRAYIYKVSCGIQKAIAEEIEKCEP